MHLWQGLHARRSAVCGPRHGAGLRRTALGYHFVRRIWPGWGEQEVTALITWEDFTKVELRVGRIVKAEPFPEARKPAYKLLLDFGPEIGTRRSSAQITRLYLPQELEGKHVVAVINFPPKQIGPFVSECLVTGFHNENGEVALCVPDQAVPLGAKLL
jgi:tRNA-binding protein